MQALFNYRDANKSSTQASYVTLRYWYKSTCFTGTKALTEMLLSLVLERPMLHCVVL
jgi:hypothetical protein